MSQYITIHQFSTGIEVQNLGEGKWISRGFTSGYMNSTLSSIPYAVERAIKNQEFDARCADNSRPAIVGRVVRYENEYWSVVTIVTIGKDESRSFPVYRYFLCEGEDNLCIILGWIVEQQPLPVFDPFHKQTKEIYINHQAAQEYRDQAKDIDTKLEKHLNNDPKKRDSYSQYPPIIVREGGYKYESIGIIDRLAYRIAQQYNYPISWSYNVQALEKPETFLIIQPATSEAYSSFQSVKRSPIALVTTSNETEIKLAIQSLAELKDIRTNLKIIENTIAEIKSHNVETLNPYLNEIFESWGISQVVDERIYQASFIEIAALRAILLPETLIKYLSYSEIEKIKTSGKKRNDIRERSLNFLNKLRKEIQQVNDLPNIKLKLEYGLLIVIEEFCQNPKLSFLEKLLYGNNTKIPLETLLWLINDTGSVWHLSKPDALMTIKRNLEKIDEYYKKDNLRELSAKETYLIYNDVITYRKRQQAIPKYKPLSYLFLRLKDYQLAHYFYVVANGRGKSDSSIVKCLPSDKKDVFGISIPRPVIANTNNNYRDQQDAKWINLFLSITILIFLLISVWMKSFNLFTIFIVIIAVVLIFIYSTEEQVRSFINKHSLPIIILALLAGNSSNLAVNLDNIGITDNNLNQQTSNTPSPTNASPSPTSNPQPPVNDNIPPQTVKRAVDEFNNAGRTREAIDRIVTNLTNDPNVWRDDEVKSALKSVLGLDNNFNYSKFSQGSTPEEVEIFVRAIIKYQKSKGLSTQNADGIIDVDFDNNPRRTMNILQEDVRKKLNNRNY